MQIKGTNMTMIRGDSETIFVSMEDAENEKVAFKTGDTLRMTIKDSLKSAVNILQKVITEFEYWNAIIILTPEDTKDLRVKEYIYDVQLTRADGTVSTIIKPSKFTIEGDVTRD